jgi:hypothetical protein
MTLGSKGLTTFTSTSPLHLWAEDGVYCSWLLQELDLDHNLYHNLDIYFVLTSNIGSLTTDTCWLSSQKAVHDLPRDDDLEMYYLLVYYYESFVIMHVQNLVKICIGWEFGGGGGGEVSVLLVFERKVKPLSQWCVEIARWREIWKMHDIMPNHSCISSLLYKYHGFLASFSKRWHREL